MQEQIEARLKELRREFEAGQTELDKVEKQRIYLNETMLRISGAIQALEELQAQEQPPDVDGIASDQPQPAGAREGGA